MRLPLPRGPISSWLVATLADQVGTPTTPPPPVAADLDPLTDDDLHLALWTCYELHYRGFDEVDDDREWDTDVLQLRATLEARFLAALREAVGPCEVEPGDVAAELTRRTSADTGRSMSRHIHRTADLGQFREFVTHRSVYHLKEADPHTFAIPRLSGRAKAAMVEIQADEYGGGRAERMHASLFADLMRSVGLDTTYGTYVDDVPGITLATNNVMSLFGLHRRHRGAAAGHLAAIEMTSSAPNRRYGQGFRRLGADDAACVFFDEHVEADAVHEQIAQHDMCGALAEAEPALAGDIVFGAVAGLYLDQLFADHVLDAWAAGRSSLHPATMARAA
ncbi:iron-containing redox enzyme family protein [Jatrophihabitans sp. YIM 134969]